MIAYGPGKADSRSALNEAVVEGTPEIGQIHTLMLVGIRQFAIAGGGKTVAIGEGDQHGYRTRRIGGIDQIEVERVASGGMIGIRIIVDRWIVMVVRDVAMDAITFHQDIGAPGGTRLSTELAALQAAVDGNDVLVQHWRHRLVAMTIVELYDLPALLAQPSHIVGITDLSYLLKTEVLQIHHRHRFTTLISRCRPHRLRNGIVDRRSCDVTIPLTCRRHRHTG